jgi:2-haloacid dehalogenase
MYKVVVFDAFGTVFDTQKGFTSVFLKYFPENGENIFEWWQQRCFEFLASQSHFQSITNYGDVVINALESCFKSKKIELPATLANDLITTYTQLEAFDDFKEFATGKWFDRVYVYSNASQQMLDNLKANIVLESKDRINFLSTENSRSFKPSLRAYTFLKHSIWYPEKEIMYVSANKWDVIGAKNYGFSACWLNRNGEEFDNNFYRPDFQITNALEIQAIVTPK